MGKFFNFQILSKLFSIYFSPLLNQKIKRKDEERERKTNRKEEKGKKKERKDKPTNCTITEFNTSHNGRVINPTKNCFCSKEIFSIETNL